MENVVEGTVETTAPSYPTNVNAAPGVVEMLMLVLYR
jgi:hypothetical protein